MGVCLNPAQKFVNLDLQLGLSLYRAINRHAISVGDPNGVMQIQEKNYQMTLFHYPFAL